MRRANLGMERNRLLIQANERLGWIIGLLIYRQDVFHFADVLVISVF